MQWRVYRDRRNRKSDRDRGYLKGEWRKDWKNLYLSTDFFANKSFDSRTLFNFSGSMQLRCICDWIITPNKALD